MLPLTKSDDKQIARAVKSQTWSKLDNTEANVLRTPAEVNL